MYDEMEVLLWAGLVIIIGYMGGQIAKRIKMPAVAGYCIAGFLVGPSVFHIVSDSLSTSFDPIKTLGLGLIALIIGGELKYSKIKKIGKSIVVITLFQVVLTFLVVMAGMRLFMGQSLVSSLLLASLATATAPAATVAVIREYKAKGPVTSTLMGVIALDDALCIIIVGISVALVKIFMLDQGILDLAAMMIPLREIFLSILLGSIIGLIMSFLLNKIRDGNEVLVLLLAAVLFNSGAAHLLEISPLLTNMLCGFTAVNLIDRPFLNQLESIEAPIFIVFFTLAGASLHLDYLLSNWLAATVYIITRAGGKILGCYWGGRVTSAGENVEKYLGLAMLPKAGVSIGLILFLQGRFPGMELIAAITAVELAAVTFYEVTGPLLTKYALLKSGEIRGAERTETVNI
ncbi:cation:proton antiporter [Candidatus Contubernalis alkaliaceticus]|uniref:cation:proton antiporter n=1 Tax=Candidatus Contubernalis alkaliaceticus TaxID=338645 RepID=UPI001F4BF874|nr:cation:proton antiporter [Candidatus Contubernalis alkalaceticus]UNC92599.1 cation:proton antiporter [Candidatus Contubernalis alkalaceticus]